MTTIALQFEATNAGFFENFGNEFVRFTTAPQLLGWELEIALNAHPACKDLIDFHYEPMSGKGHFILPESSLYPVGRHTLRYPLPNVVTQRTVYRWQDQIRDETHTHIATGVHGFESLCCSEMNAEKVEEAEMSLEGKVTCPLCKIIWQDCRAFEPSDFIDVDQLQNAAMPEVKIIGPKTSTENILKYDAISLRLIQSVIPDYRSHGDSNAITLRGVAIKQKHSILNSWQSITLGEAEMFREDLSLKDVRIAGLSMPDFLTLLFDSRSRAEWDKFISANSFASS
jgi:hypothetical protein